ncbi:MAG: hypothetical protein ACYC1D_13810 [Acidimicrobiales bacterium]
MTITLGVLVALLALALGTSLLGRQRQRRRHQANHAVMQERLVALQGRLVATEAALAGAREPAEVDTASPPPAPPPVPPARSSPSLTDRRPRQVVEALWALQRWEAESARRQLAKISTLAPDPAAEVGLADALREALARIREEIGTPSDFRSDLSHEPDPVAALLLLRSTEAVLAVLGRCSEAFDVYLHTWEGRVSVVVVCESADDIELTGPDSPTARIADAIAPAGGDLRVDRDPGDRLRARLSVAVTRA